MDLELALKIVIAIGVVTGGFWALIRLTINQFNTALDRRFETMESARLLGQQLWHERQQKHESKLDDLDRDLRRILIELPRDYVSRADYVRRETIIEGKIDQLSLKIENWMLKKGGQA